MPVQRLIADPALHREDADCIVNVDTDCCYICHTLHGEPCEWCHCRAFHAPSCPTLEGYEVPAEEDNIGGTDPVGIALYLGMILFGALYVCFHLFAKLHHS